MPKFFGLHLLIFNHRSTFAYDAHTQGYTLLKSIWWAYTSSIKQATTKFPNAGLSCTIFFRIISAQTIFLIIILQILIIWRKKNLIFRKLNNCLLNKGKMLVLAFQAAQKIQTLYFFPLCTRFFNKSEKNYLCMLKKLLFIY